MNTTGVRPVALACCTCSASYSAIAAMVVAFLVGVGYGDRPPRRTARASSPSFHPAVGECRSVRRRTQRRRSSWRRWKPLLPMLTDRHDVIAVDLPGFGTAPPLADRTPTAAGLADAVEAELDRLGLGRVHVAGNSLGGWIALELGDAASSRSARRGWRTPPSASPCSACFAGAR